MKKILLVLCLSIFSSFLINGQWRSSSSNDEFAGGYRTSSLVGIGEKSPYVNPVFAINIFKGDTANLNIYFARVLSEIVRIISQKSHLIKILLKYIIFPLARIEKKIIGF